jgi:hypothetical protein
MASWAKNPDTKIFISAVKVGMAVMKLGALVLSDGTAGFVPSLPFNSDELSDLVTMLDDIDGQVCSYSPCFLFLFLQLLYSTFPAF